jgi:hypothetical protein
MRHIEKAFFDEFAQYRNLVQLRPKSSPLMLNISLMNEFIISLRLTIFLHR